MSFIPRHNDAAAPLRVALPALFLVLGLIPTLADENKARDPDALPQPDPLPQLRIAEGPSATSSSAASPAVPAEDAPVPPSSTPAAVPTPAASPNAMVNLVNILVSQHVITQEAGDKVIQQAQQEAAQAQAQVASAGAQNGAQAAQGSDPPVDARAASGGGDPAPDPPTPDDEVRVSYVPETVKSQIADEVTAKVMQQTHADTEALVAQAAPDWVKRFHVTGDIRLRFEDDLFPSGNAVGDFTNFNAINTGAGFNVNTTTPALPQFDVDKDRDRLRIRARLGASIDLAENFSAGFRIGTGSDNSPTTENQTLDSVNSFTQGQGGNFGKYEAWIDRAFLRYDFGSPFSKQNLSITAGRFDNPFFHTSMIWSDDLAFDGAVVQGHYQVADGVTPFFAAGAFPVFNTDLNFSTYNAEKYSSEDKWLYGAQLGVNWIVDHDWSVKAAAAFYDFDNIEGQVSDPIFLASANESGNTDDSRPLFAQNGNTYIGLRDYVDPAPGTTQEIQYYGLATPFRVAALTGQVDYSGFDPFHLWLVGEFIDNTAFDRNAIIHGGPAIDPGPQNNTTGTDPNSFNGGNLGYLARFSVGKPVLTARWDWNATISYRYVESDATVDGFTDSDFGGALAGTNLKGYTIAGNVALSHVVYAGLRWMSADGIAGPTYHNDVLQLDINAGF